MKRTTLWLLCCAAVAAAYVAPAGAEKSAGAARKNISIIALKTDQFELAETDISELAVGEAKTLVTESGTVIDLLRTADGLEIYADGELVDLGPGEADSMAEQHGGLHKRIEVVCSGEDSCEETVWIDAATGLHLDTDSGVHHVIEKHIEIHCDDEAECGDHELHLEHDTETGDGQVRKIVIIREQDES